MNELWQSFADAASTSLCPDQHAQLSRYLDLLLVANQTMNLTRITDRAEAERLHVADALTLLPLLPKGPHRLADVGSGGGVPGIPLAVARPDVTLLLIESTKKKAAFLRQAVGELGLGNVTVSDQRAEEVGRSRQRETFDVAVARAVGTLDWLAEYCLPLVRKGGQVLAMKGPRVVDEIPGAKKAIKFLGGGEPRIHPVDLPGAEGHVVVIIPKVGRTDFRYLRPPSLAKNRPIG